MASNESCNSSGSVLANNNNNMNHIHSYNSNMNNHRSSNNVSKKINKVIFD